MAEYRIFSADSHFVEPPTMWVERMDAKFRDRAPRTVRSCPTTGLPRSLERHWLHSPSRNGPWRRGLS